MQGYEAPGNVEGIIWLVTLLTVILGLEALLVISYERGERQRERNEEARRIERVNRNGG